MDLFRKKSADQLLEAAERTGLAKKLTAIDLAALAIGSVVGTGIFVATGEGALRAGPGVIVSYIIGGITAALAAFIFAELVTMFPVAGSTYTYSYVAFGEIIAWIIGWDLLLEYLVSASAVASGWSGTFVGLLKSFGITLPEIITKPPIWGGVMDLPSILIVAFAAWILYIGVKETAISNNLIVALKIAVILLFIFIGISHVKLSNLTPFAPYGWKGIMSAAAIIFFAYIGFDAVSTAAEETKNPQKNVPLGLMMAMIVILALYITVAFVLVGMVPYKEIVPDNALPGALMSIGINWGSALVATGAVIGMISTLIITLYGQIRIFMVMARDGLLPEVFSHVHPKYRTPHINTIITSLLAAIIAGFLPLDIIIELCNIGTLSVFVLVSIGILVLRVKMPHVERKFRVPFVWIVAPLTAAFSIYLMASLPVVTWIRFGGWMLAGLLIYFAYGRYHSVLNVQK
ncbi:amino acid/polyamine/organocation transporter, APC superfamily (TC 2.A.3) [Thermoanaerobacter uzonensis DSM 18761]|jgi:APA family basic amino acid/polyamine antiporter|uniref:Amino acid/polyamine/organocation transporter, APC superfamily (TC 2.A.3) n=1 Tax=Thermoanaerobacter uzonensis DSM 18761 TaxID=1123369 RepID=A0A1M5AHW2_9THEO|nr:amino acid permease [Thermoanaerobacter uzonensis]SHF29858.1 amino acid/polyamine/organocation transporter, APC superfamily (TC 2.A.3) [Thermoanaerobacter uzonensis DSM 18761]